MTADLLKAGSPTRGLCALECKWVLLVSLVLSLILVLPARGYAQEAVVSGTLTDSTGAVLPGVTVTALHEASGNIFVGVTDERGAFRLPVRPGATRSEWNCRALRPSRGAGWSSWWDSSWCSISRCHHPRCRSR